MEGIAVRTGARPAARVFSFGTLLGVVTAVELGLLYIVFRNGSWVYDDTFILAYAREHGFNLKWLTTPVYEHWGIAMNAVFSLQLHFFPLDYRWGLVVMLAGLGACIWLFEQVLAMVVRRGWVTLAITAWFGLSLLWVRPLQWWVLGVVTFPMVFFDLLCLYGFLRFYAERRGRWIAVSAIALAAGLAFYEKPAFMPLYLGLIRVLFMSERLRPRALVLTFWRERRLWLSYLAVLGLWAAAYVSIGAFGSAASARHVSPEEYLRYFRIMWIDTLVPALAGIRLPVAGLTPWQTVAAVAGQLAVVTCILISVRRKRAAWRAWAFLAVVVLLTGLLVALKRVALFGSVIGSELYYLQDLVWLIPLVVCFAFARGKLLKPTPPGPARPLGLPLGRTALGLGALTLIVAYGAVSLATATDLERAWPALQARHWDANLRRGLSDFASDRITPVVADNQVPNEIVGGWLDPYSRLSRVLPLYARRVKVEGPLNGQLATVDAAGNIGPATATVVAPGGISDLIRDRLATVSNGSTDPRSGQICVSSGAPKSNVELLLPQLPGSSSAPYYLQMRYSTSRPLALPLFVDPGNGYVAVPLNSLALSPSASQTIAWLRVGSPRRLEFAIPGGARVCIDRLDIVTLRQTGLE